MQLPPLPPVPRLTEPDPGWELCPECNGRKICPTCDGDGWLSEERRCFVCGGNRWCITCGGQGQVPEPAG